MPGSWCLWTGASGVVAQGPRTGDGAVEPPSGSVLASFLSRPGDCPAPRFRTRNVRERAGKLMGARPNGDPKKSGHEGEDDAYYQGA